MMFARCAEYHWRKFQAAVPVLGEMTWKLGTARDIKVMDPSFENDSTRGVEAMKANV